MRGGGESAGSLPTPVEVSSSKHLGELMGKKTCPQILRCLPKYAEWCMPLSHCHEGKGKARCHRSPVDRYDQLLSILKQGPCEGQLNERILTHYGYLARMGCGLKVANHAS
uniref:Uncharacterized protein n=1 Tax=Sphaerodactylus townsendi TaxID=933632 RepID=A0ACB8FBP4_9SAUR